MTIYDYLCGLESPVKSVLMENIMMLTECEDTNINDVTIILLPNIFHKARYMCVLCGIQVTKTIRTVIVRSFVLFSQTMMLFKEINVFLIHIVLYQWCVVLSGHRFWYNFNVIGHKQNTHTNYKLITNVLMVHNQKWI